MIFFVVKNKLPSALERVDLAGRADLLARNLSHGEKRQLEVGKALMALAQRHYI